MVLKPGRKNKVGVYWLDAVTYAKPRRWSDIPGLTLMFTSGILKKKTKDGLILSSPLNYRFSNKTKDFEPRLVKEGDPTFLFIPMGMVKKIIPGEIDAKA